MLYNYKLYSNSWAFKKVINPDLVQSSVRFTAQKNWGQGGMSIDIGAIDTDFIHGDIIKIYANTETNRLIYTGYIDEIRETVNQGEDMQISCIGLGSILTNTVFTSGGSRTFTLNKTAGEIITDIVTYANSVNSNITSWTIATTVGSLNISFDKTNCFDALKKVIDLVPDYFFYIDETGAVNFSQTSATTDYFITFQKDLQSYNEQNYGKIFNKIYFTWNGGSKTYTDATSISTYGVRETTIDDQNILNEATADKRALKYFEENAYPQEGRELMVNREFVWKKTELLTWDNAPITWDEATMTWDTATWIFSYWYEIIRPGEMIKILNFSKVVIWQVEKLDYTKDSIKLTLNKSQNFIQLLKE